MGRGLGGSVSSPNDVFCAPEISQNYLLLFKLHLPPRKRRELVHPSLDDVRICLKILFVSAIFLPEQPKLKPRSNVASIK